MEVNVFLLCFTNLFIFLKCTYPPTGEEVLPGSVLLPATRRGRYLANIVRRQAVDGTGIKFNKDADRMNAEAKKKVDILSDELLPYIIAEQDRRVTLYRRVMTAIQNGEKGVTIAELRNKPPLIIRKGVMYRCPANRAPREPDGSGSLMCEDDIEPLQVMYDSCLSAEDKDLYVAENKYFFCNRHRIEGPDLPRNGSSVIGCPPIERTSLNYTSLKCALEDTDDVVVHYRYYPDRTYKFVSELDPDREVCDHWNPCQIGYIYSLPTPDQAVLASEIFRYDEYEQDAIEEYVHFSATNYTASPRRVKIPPGYRYEKLWAKRQADNYGWNPEKNRWHSTAVVTEKSKFIAIKLIFPPSWSEYFYSEYYAVFTKIGQRSATKSVKFLTLSPSTTQVNPKTIEVLMGRRQNATIIPFKCPRCLTQNIVVRSADGHVHNLDRSKYKLVDRQTLADSKQYIEILVDDLKPREFGDLFMIVQNADGLEERVKLITIETIKVSRVQSSLLAGEPFDASTQFACDDCVLSDVACGANSAVAAGVVAVVPVSRTVAFNIPAYDDTYSGVYLGFFKMNAKDKLYSKVIAVLETPSVKVSPVLVPAPQPEAQVEYEVPYTCSEECAIESVSINGIPLQTSFRRQSQSCSLGFYVYTDSTITIRITEYTCAYEGVYQAVFSVRGENITKTVLEIGNPPDILEVTSTTQPGAADSTPSAGEGETTTEGTADQTTIDAATSEGTSDKSTTDEATTEETANKTTSDEAAIEATADKTTIADDADGPPTTVAE